MKLLATHDQHELGWFDANDGEITFTRHAARAVLRDRAGRIAVMYFTETGAYKLPGGGIDEGESIVSALHREVAEETGYEIDNVRELGEVIEYRYVVGMKQVSFSFLADVAKFVGTSLTEKEQAEGMSLVWCDTIDDAIAAINQASTDTDNESHLMHEMMKLRETVILKAAREH